MMPIKVDPGTTFGKLTVLRRGSNTKQGKQQFVCRCACGKTGTYRWEFLRTGHTNSCGCLQREVLSKNRKTHGKSDTTEYGIWSQMKTRCLCPTVPGFRDYGGRGIAVCDRWKKSFSAFLADMGPRPSKLYSLDRINNDGNYEPGNCRWALAQQQQKNKRSSRRLTINGETLTLGEWASRAGERLGTIWARLNRGWAPVDAVQQRQRGISC